MDTIEKNPSVVERQAREIRALKARIDVLETNYQHQGQMRVEAEWKVRALAVAHIKRRLMPAAEAGALANDAGDKRYHANIDLWENALCWLHLVSTDEETAVRDTIRRWENDLRRELAVEGFSPEEIYAVVAENVRDWDPYAREEWREEQRKLFGLKAVPLAKDTQVDDLRRRIAALSRDVAAHQERFGKDPQVVAWLREIAPAPTELAEPK